MKLDTIPPPPPSSSYVLELSRAELVRLARLSYKAEPGGPHPDEHTFYHLCPDDVRAEVKRQAATGGALQVEFDLW